MCERMVGRKERMVGRKERMVGRKDGPTHLLKGLSNIKNVHYIKKPGC